MKFNIFGLALTIILITSACQPRVEDAITLTELQSILDYIATDSLKGRYPGTSEDEVLAAYIAVELKIAGAELQSDMGTQYFDVNMGVSYAASNSISFGDLTYNYDDDAQFQPLGFSSNGIVSAEIVIGNMKYLEGLDEGADWECDGKWLMVLSEDVPGTMHSDRETYLRFRTFGLKASDHKAAGIIYISSSDEGLKYPELTDRNRLEISIPAIMVSRKLAKEIIESQVSVEFSLELLKNLTSFISTVIDFTAETQIDILTSPSFNTTAFLAGSIDSLSDEIVVIGAHHDHLGWGGRGTSSRQADTVAVHYGADDNASGVAGVLELAEYIESQEPGRSFSFLTFGGEEMGLLGSKYFTENPSIDLEKVQCMINLDMIGRLNEDRQIQIGGIGTSPLFRSLLDNINLKYDFNLKYSEAGYGPSDHSSFYAKDIPVLFISTGAHTDYHTPADDINKINFEGMQELLYFVADIAMELANMPDKIEFTEAGPKTGSNSRGRMGGITFGLMPDMTYDGNEGMPVTFVTEGKPAAACGMTGGDIIKAVDGKRVGNVYDYMERLGQLKAGQAVIVKIERDEEEMELLLQL